MAKIEYKVPKYRGDFSKFNLHDFEDKVKRVIASNSVMYNSACDSHSQAVNACALHYGYNSKEVRYITNREPDEPPNLYRKSLAPVLKKYQKWEDKQKSIAKYRDYVKRSESANARLESFGFVPYEDFEPSSAITGQKRLLDCDRNGKYFIRVIDEEGTDNGNEDT